MAGVLFVFFLLVFADHAQSSRCKMPVDGIMYRTYEPEQNMPLQAMHIENEQEAEPTDPFMASINKVELYRMPLLGCLIPDELISSEICRESEAGMD